MSCSKTLILFDVDGTIAESSKKVKDSILIKLSFLKGNKYEYGLISGGKYEKIINQVGYHYIEPNKGPLFKYLFCENGMIGYINNEKFFERRLDKLYTYNQFKNIEKYILDSSKKYLVNNHNSKLERRNSMWYFSPAGVYCNDEYRKSFVKDDIKNNIRLKIIELLKEKLKTRYNLEIRLGGNIGLTIYPTGWDKSYIIKNKLLDISKYKNVYFFGDRCSENGNDYPLYILPEITGIKVNNPDDTLEILTDIDNNIL